MKQTDETNAKVLAQLQEYAQLYFSAIVELHGDGMLRPGKYSAKELTDRAKCPMREYYFVPQDAIFDEIIEISEGDFSCAFPYRCIFAVLGKWESMMRAGRQKAVFEVGGVEQKKAKALLDDGHGTTEKSVTVRRLVGNWWIAARTKRDQHLYYELNGVMFDSTKSICSEENLYSDSIREWCEGFDDGRMAELLQKSAEKANRYAQAVAKRIGLEWDEAAAEGRRLMLEEERRRKEEEVQRLMEELRREEIERRRADERRRAEGRRSLLGHKPVTVEQIELLAESVGYEINIRTIGFMREKVTAAELMESGCVRVHCRNLTSRNIDGTCAAVWEIAERLKAQAEEESMRTAQAAETPQISAAAPEMENAPAGEENAPGAADERESIEPGEAAIRTERQVEEISSLIQRHGFGFSGRPGDAQRWRLHKDGRAVTDFLAIPQLWQWLADYDAKNAPQPQAGTPAMDLPAKAGKAPQGARRAQNRPIRRGARISAEHSAAQGEGAARGRRRPKEEARDARAPPK